MLSAEDVDHYNCCACIGSRRVLAEANVSYLAESGEGGGGDSETLENVLEQTLSS